MGYVVKNQYGVISVQDEATLNDPHEIRFIDSHYKLHFTIPDHDMVIIDYHDERGKKAFTCHYIDDYHLRMVSGNGSGSVFHICELAEKMERAGAAVIPFPEKRIIWSDRNLDLKDWIVDLHEEYPELNREQLTEKMYEINAEYLGDERMNLDVQVGSDIIAIADLGRWNGRFSGYKLIESGNLADCLSSGQDSNEWYVDREGEFRSTQVHHDGTNYIYYRKFKDDASWDDRDELLGKIYEGKATQEDIDKLTDKLGTKVAEVYGWDFPDPEPAVKAKNKDNGAR